LEKFLFLHLPSIPNPNPNPNPNQFLEFSERFRFQGNRHQLPTFPKRHGLQPPPSPPSRNGLRWYCGANQMDQTLFGSDKPESLGKIFLSKIFWTNIAPESSDEAPTLATLPTVAYD
jgi:hypothetical protein